MIEHRLAERLISYWNLVRKDLPLPDFGHFNASAIADIWHQCVLFTVAPDALGRPYVLNFYQIGDRLKAVYGTDMVGRSFNTAQRHFQGATIVRRIEELIEHPTPLTDAGQFINDRHKVIKYRSCMLPFGRNDQVTHVLVGLSWREF